MNEQNVSNLDVEAILANEELVKKLAAKVLDIIQQKPDAGVVCQGYYCNMAKGDQAEDWKCVCKKKLDSLDMELEDGLAASVAEDYPLNAEELDQVVTEIKTSEAYAGRLSRADMSRAVSKVLADNEIMRRKGGAELMKLDFDYKKYFCTSCGPNRSIGFSVCSPCGPNKSYIGSPCSATFDPVPIPDRIPEGGGVCNFTFPKIAGKKVFEKAIKDIIKDIIRVPVEESVVSRLAIRNKKS